MCGTKKFSYPLQRSVEDERYIDYVVARYQAFSNIFWDIMIQDISQLSEQERPWWDLFRHMQSYFSKVGFWTLDPADGLSSSGLCLTDHESQYLCFKPLGNYAVHLRLTESVSHFGVEWFNPLTGETAEAGRFNRNRFHEFKSPWGEGMAVLRILTIKIA
jgi:hypothetical protein